MRNRVFTVIVALAAFAFGGASSCNKPNPNPPTSADGGSPSSGNPVVSGLVNCAEQGLHNVWIHLIDDVNSALATGNYENALLNLVNQFGEAAVVCAVNEVFGTTSLHAKMDSLEATKASRAKAWLDKQSVKPSAMGQSKSSGVKFTGDLRGRPTLWMQDEETSNDLAVIASVWSMVNTSF